MQSPLIIIDTPANSNDIAMLAAEQADFVIIAVAPRGLDVHSVLQTVKQVQQAGKKLVLIHIPEDMHRALRQLSVEEGGNRLPSSPSAFFVSIWSSRAIRGSRREQAARSKP